MSSLRSVASAFFIAIAFPVLSCAATNIPVTFVVGVPYVSQNSGPGLLGLYSDLLNRLAKPFSVNRILLSVESPSINATYTVGDSVSDSGISIQFLSQLPAGIEVYAYPDVEAGAPSAWSTWQPPSNSKIPSCVAAISAASGPHQDALKSICWASSVNQLLENANAKAKITGVVYEGQSFEDKSEALSGVLYTETQADGLKLGWFSSGVLACTGATPCVDMNFIEVYDLNKGAVSAKGSPYRVDTIAPETVVGGDFAVDATCSSTNSNDCVFNNIFPGKQLSTSTYDAKHAKDVPTGEVGANIYNCAVDSQDSASDCTQYSVVSSVDSPEAQMMSSLAYIYNNNADPTQLNAKELSGNQNVVYLFSAQYIGPIGSYYGSGQQCSEKAGNCNCVASAYDPKGIASCGDESGFGTWGDAPNEGNQYLPNFQNFLNNFSAQICAGSNNCGVGVYMYDYLPAQWFSSGS